jgi:hypothetical protein
MSEYTEALSELAELPRRLEERLAHSKREVMQERRRREQEAAAYVAEHEAVLNRLEEILGRARSEGVDLDAAGGVDRERTAGDAGAEPLEYARQLVGRLDRALADLRHTRQSLAAEEATLSEEERRRISEERRRHELQELRRGERWEKARQGSVGLLAALAAAAAVGMLAGAIGAVAVVVVPILAAAACFGLASTALSTLPALAVRRATGSIPTEVAAPPRESRLAAAGFAAAGLGLSGAGMTALGFAAGAPSSVTVVASVFTLCGAAALAAVWLVLPRLK